MSDNQNLLRDTESRRRIVRDIDTNFFVEAGAGSGKTTMLVNRMAAMVEHGIPIEKICAITFTKAAAGEFYDRFQKTLIERSNPDYVPEKKGYAGELADPTPETREYCAKALQDIDLCFMGTIDSFCNMILSEHPSEAGIPADAHLISAEEAEYIYRQEYLRRCRNPGPALKTFIRIYSDPEEVFARGMSVLMSHRNTAFRFDKPADYDIDKLFAADRSSLLDMFDYYRRHPDLEGAIGNDTGQKVFQSFAEYEKTISGKWSTDLGNVKYALDQLKKISLKANAVDNKHIPHINGWYYKHGSTDRTLKSSLTDQDGTLTKVQDYIYSVSMEALAESVPEVEKAVQSGGNLTYFDYLYYLREMLRKDAASGGKLIRYIYDRHSYFLIDEFQDTDPMQAEIFFYLTAEKPVEDWRNCKPRPHSLFIVGDPKQSIYRFRGADVSSFLKVKEIFRQRGGEVLALTRNFRSVRTLCGSFNSVFSVLLPEETGDQSRFEKIPLPEETGDEFEGVYKYTAYPNTLKAEHPQETDPKQIGKIVRQLVDNDRYMIREKAANGHIEKRRLRYSDIMIIPYSKKNIPAIMDELDTRDIPVKVEGAVPFESNPGLFEIYRIYAAAADRDDTIMFYGALTGKVIGLSNEKLLQYKGAIEDNFIFADPQENSEKPEDPAASGEVAEEIKKLKELQLEAYRYSPAALFAKIMEDYKIYRSVKAENLEVVYYTLELLRNAEAAGEIVTLKDGAAFLKGLIEGTSGEERCLSLNADMDAVHLANLHKVKGLEAPVVILAAAADNSHKGAIRIDRENNTAALFHLHKPEGQNVYYFQTGCFENEEDDEQISADAEKLRLIYVAATRAKNALIVCERMKKVRGGRLVADTLWSPILSNGGAVPFEFASEDDSNGKKAAAEETVAAKELYNEAEKGCVIGEKDTPRDAEKVTYRLENPSREHLPSKMSDDEFTDVDLSGDGEEANEKETKKAPSVSAVHRYPALLGTMTHKLMEMMVSSGNRVDTDEAVREILQEYLTTDHAGMREALRKALTDVAVRMNHGGYPQENDAPQDLLNVLLHADEVYCELPFCYTVETEAGKELWNGIMDLVYCENGKWHIIDYKTNADGNDLDRKYQAQLSAYQRAFKAASGQDADARIYHIDI